MTSIYTPVIGNRYLNHEGEWYEVIGLGTQGVVVEYIDGRAEVIDLRTWTQHSADPASQQTADP